MKERIALLEWEAAAARKDRELLATLLDIRRPQEGPKYQRSTKDTLIAEPTADEQFAAAFRRWGLDVDGSSPAEVAAKLKTRPSVVVTEVSAAVDEWASERRRQGKAKETWPRLVELAALLDADPGSKRRELRQIVARGRLERERALDVLSAALRPVPVPMEVPLGPDRPRLRQLAKETDAAREPILGLLTLVRALIVAGEETRAEQLLRATIVARPREVVLHYTLGAVLVSQQPPRWAEAVECYGAARTLRPDLGVNLATAVRSSGRDAEGLAVLAQLVSEKPTNPYLHFQLALALYHKRQLDEAVAEYRQAIRLKTDLAEAYCNLGHVLRQQGRFDEALASLRQGHELGAKQPGWRYPSARWVQNAERMLMLDKKLPALLRGEELPANPGEAIALASMCQQPYQKRYAASARLYADAFASEPKLVADLIQQHRYNAACPAALAAAGQGEDARLQPDKVAVMFRRWALGWLRQDLQAYARLAQQNNPKLNQAIHQRLVHWRRDPDLTSVRDPQALDRLPDTERAAWQAVWREVDQLAKRVAKQNEATQGREKPQTPKANP